MRIGIVAGETSGDILGSSLIAALKKQNPELEFEGIGGPLMIENGCQSYHPMEKLSLLGLVEVLKHLPEVLAIQKHIIRHFLDHPPDVFIGIDAPDFNLKVERTLKTAGIKTIHYVSPTIWAWRTYRVHKIAKSVDLILSIFPFEVDFYKKYQVPVKFIGHPLADIIDLENDKAAARKTLSLTPDKTILALLPGSRHSELEFLCDDFLETAYQCYCQDNTMEFIIPLATPALKTHFEKKWEKYHHDFPLTMIDGQSRTVMIAADLILLASGTATLEALLIKRPMVVAYRISAVTYWILKKFKIMKINYFSMPNLLAGEEIVKEFIQDDINPKMMANTLLSYLKNPQQHQQIYEKFHQIHQILRLDSSIMAAKAVLEITTKP